MKTGINKTSVCRKQGVHLGLFICGALLLAGNVGRASNEILEQLARQKPTRLVNDYAGAFTQGQWSSLEGILEELARKTGAEIAVVVLPSLDGGEINDFATRLYEKWGIGQKGKDNGALLLAALGDRKVRIEVGYGLEGILPDAKTGRILDEAVLPAFRQNRYAEGLTQGAVAIAGVIARNAGVSLTGMPVVRTESRSQRGSPLLGLLFLIFFIPLLIRHPFLAILLLSGMRGGGFSGGGFGGGFGGFGGGLSGGGGASRSW